jgi:cytochrome b/DNA-binding CsgD family transcriptional regulator
MKSTELTKTERTLKSTLIRLMEALFTQNSDQSYSGEFRHALNSPDQPTEGFMKKLRVYDLPTRVFHWVFVGLFVGAFFISKVFDDDSSAYPYHMLMGLMLASAVFLRMVWGFVGSRYARFSSFALRPSDLVNYFKDLVAGKAAQKLGHNPASSWAALTMMGLALALAVSGYLMTQGSELKESLEDIHELLANAFMIVAIAHVSGIILHSFTHRDAIGLSMIHGKKVSLSPGGGIDKSYPVIALIFLVLISLIGIFLLLRGSFTLKSSLELEKRNVLKLRAESERWRAQSKKYLDGLSEAIEAQLAAWSLSTSEKEIAFLLLKGLSLKDIALIRNTAEKTVRSQSVSIYSKAGLAG